MGDSANAFDGRYGRNTRSAAAAAAAAARKTNSYRHGTSSPSATHQNFLASKGTYRINAEIYESSDSGSSDSEQEREIQNKWTATNDSPSAPPGVICKACGNISDKATNGSPSAPSYATCNACGCIICKACGSILEKATNDSRSAPPYVIHKTHGSVSDRATNDCHSSLPYATCMACGSITYRGTNGGPPAPLYVKCKASVSVSHRATNVSPSAPCYVMYKASKAANDSSTQSTQSSVMYKTNSKVSHKATNDIHLYVILSVIILALGIIYCCGCLTLDDNYPSLEERKSQLQDRFREIRKQFPTQDDSLWSTLYAGIKKVEENPSQPSTFLLLHDFDDDTPKCLAVKMSKAATEFLKATDPSPLKFQGEELGANINLIEDHGILISEQKENITNHRAVIIFNLHKIPASVAQCFHYFCDEYKPVVQKAVYFFTMSVAKRLHNSPTHVAEIELKKLWQQQLETDKLQPLIVRLTTSVMVIKPEEELASSCDS